MKKNNYYIEIRYFGKAKYQIKRIIQDVNQKFKLNPKHIVPHITLVQPFSTNNSRKMVQDFKRVCSKYELMKFTVNSIGVFPFFVVFAKVHPDRMLLNFRLEMLSTLRKYCRIKDVNRSFKPHTTIALRMGLIKFFKIWFYMLMKPKIRFTNHVMRVTLLKGNKIMYEFDFTHQKMLTRNQAKSRKQLSRTFRKLKKMK